MYCTFNHRFVITQMPVPALLPTGPASSAPVVWPELTPAFVATVKHPSRSVVIRYVIHVINTQSSNIVNSRVVAF